MRFIDRDNFHVPLESDTVELFIQLSEKRGVLAKRLNKGFI
jgi:hypothetical protein